MVLLKVSTNALVAAPFELQLESNRMIRFIAPKAVKVCTDARQIFEGQRPVRKNSGYTVTNSEEEWEGVGAMCQYLDTAIDVDKELFDGSSVLEIGFASGLPSVFAMENGASDVTIHCQTKAEMDCFVKPTLSRNKIPTNKCKFSSGDIQDLRKAIGGKKFDVILAVEPLRCSATELEQLHEVLDTALAADGVCLIISRTHTFHFDASLPAFKEVVKRFHKFDWIGKWGEKQADIVQWKVVQLTHSIY
ncbi:unnamed protein product, partial [Mesorhabditis belari]|uniref:Uncharacterized protein n=1 Tax=Mesorhabditis belari TaxID=2138241 RepID=A0AAF3E7Y4_9BILA